jgi:fructose-1,6-bisphosphatase/inositol monophosphatase family enzyme
MSKEEFQVAPFRDEPYERTMQTAVVKALNVIWLYRFDFTSESKVGIGDRKVEFVSSVDRKAQDEMVATLREKHLLEEYGFICEEEGVELWNGTSPYFTIDPLDGTCPFIRGNFHAVSSMVAAVRNGNVEAVCIGDLSTRELISYGPTSTGVNYFSGERHVFLSDKSSHKGGLENSRLLLRRQFSHYSPVIQKLAEDSSEYLVTDESLGVWMARLWKQEVCMVVLCKGSKVTPWDITPIIGISLKLGYAFLRVVQNGTRLERFIPDLPVFATERSEDVLIIHEHDLSVVHSLMAE